MKAHPSRPLDAQVAVVTGGDNDLGRAIALALSAHGAGVLVTGQDERRLGETVGEIAHGAGKARHAVGDARDVGHLQAAMRRAAEDLGELRIVVACSAFSMRSTGTAHDLVRTNLLAVHDTFEAASPILRGPGRLIALSDGAARVGEAEYLARAASHAGVLGLVEAVARHRAARRITANAIVPGDAAPEEVAELAVFLCGRAGDAINGQILRLGS
jgi:NAD(P)-dependent dehydrogenase (short-subunit alcohol dehydrogenase family)